MKIKEILPEEVGGNYLYHSTEDAETAKKILSSGVLKASMGPQDATVAQVGNIPTVSFGRNLAYQMSGANVGRDYSVIFVFDRARLEQRYKTIGTSQSGVSLDKKKKFGFNIYKDINRYDINKDGYMSDEEVEVWQKENDSKLPGANLKTSPEEFKDLYRGWYKRYGQSKSGGEFEEVVPTKTGSIPLKGILIGFYLIPGKNASKDQELINHPLRLELTGPNRFKLANEVSN